MVVQGGVEDVTVIRLNGRPSHRDDGIADHAPGFFSLLCSSDARVIWR